MQGYVHLVFVLLTNKSMYTQFFIRLAKVLSNDIKLFTIYNFYNYKL